MRADYSEIMQAQQQSSAAASPPLSRPGCPQSRHYCRYSMYSLYTYKSTKTDAKDAATLQVGPCAQRAGRRIAASLQALIRGLSTAFNLSGPKKGPQKKGRMPNASRKRASRRDEVCCVRVWGVGVRARVRVSVENCSKKVDNKTQVMK